MNQTRGYDFNNRTYFGHIIRNGKYAILWRIIQQKMTCTLNNLRHFIMLEQVWQIIIRDVSIGKTNLVYNKIDYHLSKFLSM